MSGDTLRFYFELNIKVLTNTNKEIRALAMNNLVLIYMSVEESFDEIKKAFMKSNNSFRFLFILFFYKI